MKNEELRSYVNTLTTLNSQLSTLNPHPLSIINYQLSIIHYQSPYVPDHIFNQEPAGPALFPGGIGCGGYQSSDALGTRLSSTDGGAGGSRLLPFAKMVDRTSSGTHCSSPG